MEYENIVWSSSDNKLNEHLQQATQTGFELVSAVRDSTDNHVFGTTPWWLFFKRPIVKPPIVEQPPKAPSNPLEESTGEGFGLS